jgi:hypothetical protein
LGYTVVGLENELCLALFAPLLGLFLPLEEAILSRRFLAHDAAFGDGLLYCEHVPVVDGKLCLGHLVLLAV